MALSEASERPDCPSTPGTVYEDCVANGHIPSITPFDILDPKQSEDNTFDPTPSAAKFLPIKSLEELHALTSQDDLAPMDGPSPTNHTAATDITATSPPEQIDQSLSDIEEFSAA